METTKQLWFRTENNDDLRSHRLIIGKTSEGMSPHIRQVQLTWFERALFETSPHPRGGFKQYWTMKLMRSGHRCQLPRGFVKGNKPVFVGHDTRHRQNKN